MPKLLWPFVKNDASLQSRGLVGWWPGSPGSGSKLLDLSGNAVLNYGALSGFGYSITSGWTAGVDGGLSAIRFDGTDDLVNFGDLTYLNSASAFTISVWDFRATNIITLPIGKINAVASANMVGINPYNDGNVYIEVRTATNQEASIAYAVLGWTQYTMVFNGAGSGNTGRLQMYVNGAQRSITFGVGSIPSASPNLAGYNATAGDLYYDSSHHYKAGAFEDLKIWNRALTASEAWELFDPRTRWDLRYQPRRILFSIPPVSSDAGTLVGSVGYGSGAYVMGE